LTINAKIIEAVQVVLIFSTTTLTFWVPVTNGFGKGLGKVPFWVKYFTVIPVRPFKIVASNEDVLKGYFPS
jgi:hypothetical protein